MAEAKSDSSAATDSPNNASSASSCVSGQQATASIAKSKRVKHLVGSIDETMNLVEQDMRQLLIKHLHGSIGAQIGNNKKKSDKDKLKKLINETVENVRADTEEQIAEMIEENDMKPLLANLDVMDEEQQGRKRTKAAWRPTGHPESDLADHYTIARMEYRDDLKRLVAEETARTEQSKLRVLAGRERVTKLDKEIEEKGKIQKRRLELLKNKTDEQGRQRLNNEELEKIRDEMKARKAKLAAIAGKKMKQ